MRCRTLNARRGRGTQLTADALAGLRSHQEPENPRLCSSFTSVTVCHVLRVADSLMALPPELRDEGMCSKTSPPSVSIDVDLKTTRARAPAMRARRPGALPARGTVAGASPYRRGAVGVRGPRDRVQPGRFMPRQLSAVGHVLAVDARRACLWRVCCGSAARCGAGDLVIILGGDLGLAPTST